MTARLPGLGWAGPAGALPPAAGKVSQVWPSAGGPGPGTDRRRPVPGRCSGVPGAGAVRRAARGAGGAGLPAVPRSRDGISLPRVLHSVGKLPVPLHGVSGRVPTGKRSDDSGTPDRLQAGRSALSHLGTGGAGLPAGCPGRVTVTGAREQENASEVTHPDLAGTSPLVITVLRSRSARSSLSAHSQEP